MDRVTLMDDLERLAQALAQEGALLPFGVVVAGAERTG